VGAGPGDPELLTIKALKAIQAATVLLVDDLVSDAIVAHVASARIVYVGKRGGCKSTPQAFIEKLMLMAVNEGENVVRLKGATRSSLAVAAKRWNTCARQACR
jgi:uroporphyrin-III C-methyltransferase